MGCYNTCVVDAPVDKVWAVLRDFHELSWASDVVTKVERVGEAKGDQVGAGRILNGAFHETLIALDDTERILRYRIDDGPGPVAKGEVTDYVGRIRAFPVTDRDATFVEWSSSWKDSNGGVKEFCDPIYKTVLDALKRRFTQA